jgi:DNA end-binding protein Ku
MAPRANWKGFLRIADLTCAVALYTAASTSERIALHMVNRRTRNRLHRIFVDSGTGKPVDADDQVKGYETEAQHYIVVEPGEIAAAIPESDKTLDIQAFVACDAIDDLYFGRPYYLAPSGPAADKPFAVLVAGMRDSRVVAIARAVLFRRMRTLLLRIHGEGLIATTLAFDYEVRSSRSAFADIPKIKMTGEMLDLAKHIIATKTGTFDAGSFEDRYEQALAAMVQAKIQGKPLKPRPPVRATNVVDLMAALRQSAGQSGAAGKPKHAKTRKPPGRPRPAASRRVGNAR